MMEPDYSPHSSTSDMSFDDDESIQDFLSIIESEYDSGLDTSYSDFSASTSTCTSLGADVRDDLEGFREPTIQDVEPTPVSYFKPNAPCFEPLPPLRNSSEGSFGLLPPSFRSPAFHRNSSYGSMFDDLLLTKPISSIGSVGTVNSNMAFDLRDTFPPPLTSLSRQITPPAPPPPIPSYMPFSGGYRRETSRKISEEVPAPMDVDRETSSENQENQHPPSLPPPPPPPAIQVTPPTPRAKKSPATTSTAKAKSAPATRSTCQQKTNVSNKRGASSQPKTTNPTKRTSSQSSSPKPKRKRKEKKRTRRVEPKVKKYVGKTAKDVLMGRGGCSNHHPGNENYRKRILKLQKTYKTLSREAKTKMSKDVVKWVYSRGGQFLQREGKDSWYVVTTETARQKVSQALREDHTVEGRMLKKARTNGNQQDSNVQASLVTSSSV